jgi:hypothetical protein
MQVGEINRNLIRQGFLLRQWGKLEAFKPSDLCRCMKKERRIPLPHAALGWASAFSSLHILHSAAKCLESFHFLSPT